MLITYLYSLGYACRHNNAYVSGCVYKCWYPWACVKHMWYLYRYTLLGANLMIKYQTTREKTREMNGSQFLANLARSPLCASRCALVIWNAKRAVIKYTYYSITWWLIDSLHFAHKAEPGIKAAHVSHTASYNYEINICLIRCLNGRDRRSCVLTHLVCECVKEEWRDAFVFSLLFLYVFLYENLFSIWNMW